MSTSNILPGSPEAIHITLFGVPAFCSPPDKNSKAAGVALGGCGLQGDRTSLAADGQGVCPSSPLTPAQVLNLFRLARPRLASYLASCRAAA